MNTNAIEVSESDFFEPENVIKIKVKDIMEDIKVVESIDDKINILVKGTVSEDYNYEIVMKEENNVIKVEIKNMNNKLTSFAKSYLEAIVAIPKTYRNKVDILSISGNVFISKVEIGSINIQTVSGDIDIKSLKADTKIKTVSGNMHLFEVAGNIEIDTVSGDTHLKGEYGVDFRTISGKLRYHGEIRDKGFIGKRTVIADEPHKHMIYARSVSGDVEID